MALVSSLRSMTATTRTIIVMTICFVAAATNTNAFVVPNQARLERPKSGRHESPTLAKSRVPSQPVLPLVRGGRRECYGGDGLGRGDVRSLTLSLHAVSTSNSNGNFLGPLLSASATTLQSACSALFSTTTRVSVGSAFALNAALFALLRSKLSKMLTPAGFLHAMALGTGLWSTLGWPGWTLCVLYLFLGQAVTKVRFADKERRGIAESRGGRRGPENVWGSAATLLACAVAAVQGDAFLGVAKEFYILGGVASVSTKLADTFASEIGKAYGKTTFLITTFERVPPGTEGAVSLEGTLAAFFGGFLLPLYAKAVGLLTCYWQVVFAAIAAFLATNVESVLGATLQGKKGLEWMTNEMVNFCNTVIGAAIAMGLQRVFP